VDGRQSLEQVVCDPKNNQSEDSRHRKLSEDRGKSKRSEDKAWSGSFVTLKRLITQERRVIETASLLAHRRTDGRDVVPLPWKGKRSEDKSLERVVCDLIYKWSKEKGWSESFLTIKKKKAVRKQSLEQVVCDPNKCSFVRREALSKLQEKKEKKEEEKRRVKGKRRQTKWNGVECLTYKRE
jgi:hypothetical protein